MSRLTQQAGPCPGQASGHASITGGRPPFLELISRRKWVVGTVLSAADPVLAKKVAQSFDFAWIDLEHSCLTIRDIQIIAIALKAGGAAGLVRLPSFDSELLGAALDAGVDGVVAPKVESPAQAAHLVDALHYPPRGSRGFAPRRGTAPPTEGRAGHRRHIACVIQIETKRALENLDELAGTDGVDALVVGTADLSFELELPLHLRGAALMSAVDSVRQAATRHGKEWGVAVGALPEWVADLPRQGASMLAFSSDFRLYANAIEHAADSARAIAHNVLETEATGTRRHR